MARTDRKAKSYQFFGMSIDTARRKLVKNLLFEFMYHNNSNICFRCKNPILSPEDLAIEHVQDWVDNPELFWDLSNLTFSHINCDRRNAMISVEVVNEKGQKLDTYQHKDKTYVVGNRGKRYNIKISNKSHRRVELVVSVDGRDAISGEEADYTNSAGYILGPYGSTIIEGFRRNLDDVAAFRFSDNEDSYSSLEGTPENVGVIGVAVFREVFVHYFQPLVKKYIYEPWPRPHIYDYPYNHPQVFYGASANSAPVERGSSILRGASGGQVVNCCSVGESAPQQDLGTEYGEVVSSPVRETHFERANPNTPDEIVTVYYDSEDALIKKGVVLKNPEPRTPEPFPKTKPVGKGFAKPPKKRR